MKIFSEQTYQDAYKILNECMKQKTFIDFINSVQEADKDHTVSLFDFEYQNRGKLKIDGGVFRVVICPPNKNFVLKLAQHHSYEPVLYREKDIYMAACDNNIGDMFAKCDVIDFYGVPVEIMELVPNIRDYDRIESAATAYVDKSIDCRSDLERSYEIDNIVEETDMFMGELLEGLGYDYDVISLFEEFCDEFGINDLHCGNFGFVDEKIVFVDYAGYWRG